MSLYLLARGLRNRAYFDSLKQRCGYLPASFKQTLPGSIWLHAVSVGEAMAAAALVRQLRQSLPRSPVFVSVSTLAGYQIALQKLPDAKVFYVPVDYVSAVRRVLRLLRPSLVIVMETEIWPNLFREAKRMGAGLLLVNARISDRAIGRYTSLRWFFGGVLEQVDLVMAQSEEMRQRFVRIGAPASKVRVGGNLKYDFEPREAAPDSPVRPFIQLVAPRAVWIAASTMAPAPAGGVDEDDAVLAAFREVSAHEPGLLLVLAPRKPESFDTAAHKLEGAGVRFLRRSELRGGESVALPAALLLDSIGELSTLFPLANVVFMGGTLAARGGHNILEPALAARPVIAGPHMENFAEIAADFRAAGALLEVRDSAGLAAAVIEMLANPAQAAELGERARACAQAKQGATSVATRAAQDLFAAHLPCYRPPQPGFVFLWLLSKLWIWGGGVQRKRDLARRQRLESPVISIGNITAGGTGKTPIVLYVAEKLKQAGWNPGILTRGYGRHSPYQHDALAAGMRVPVQRSGDEPQIYLRAGVAPVGIGANRWHAGRMLEQQFGVNVLLLDDGFQHVRLERRIDIVLVDASNPLGGGFALPLGRLREPIAGLARAGIMVITRSDSGRLVESAEQLLRRHNPCAPIFRARVLPEAWVAHLSGETTPAASLPFSRVAAFCGLGNPHSFWSTLAVLGCKVVDRLSFDDHHVYKPRELRAISHQFRQAGAEAVLTTEKDMVNLCDGCGRLLAPLPLYWLRIGVHVEEEAAFLDALARRLR